MRALLCRLGIHHRRKVICSWCLYFAHPGDEVWINRCLNPDCPESGPPYCKPHQDAK